MSKNNIGLQCYEHNLWLAYADGSLPAAQTLRMEEHLLECSTCLDTYLGIIEDRLAVEGIPKLGEDFTAKVLKAIEEQNLNYNLNKTPPKLVGDNIQTSGISAEVNSSGIKEAREEKEAHPNRKVNLLIYYCAAAGIAMFFWVSGFFADLSGSLSKSADYLHARERVAEKASSSQGLIQTGWTQKVLETKRPVILDYFIKLKKE
ncbi:MAG TPA: zf-HC2 domain-containing protein [Peptococcaceae bacterium]|nr:zf-HC2 domain-containing protein [Peptococcaceae bacterium]